VTCSLVPGWTALLVTIVSVPIHPVVPLKANGDGVTLVMVNEDPATVVEVAVVEPDDVDPWMVK